MRKVPKTIRADKFRPVNMLFSIQNILEKTVSNLVLKPIEYDNILSKFQ